MRTIIEDQQTKLEIIKKIDTTQVGVDPRSLLDGLLQTLNLISTVLMVVEIACATNPATIAISAILLVLNSVLSIFSLINNIKAIDELKKKKKTL